MMTTDYEWIDQVCPTCQRTPTRYLGTRGGQAHRQGLGVECRVWQCESCTLIFPHPMPVPIGGLEQHYALESEDYFRHHREADKEAEAGRLLNEAETLLGRRGSLLDIGCGRGEMLKAALQAGWEPTGIEPAASFAGVARCAGAPVIESPVEECRLPDQSFDVAILSAVLEHLYSPDTTVAAIARCLRPGGLLFLDVPNEMGLYFRLGNLYQRLLGRDWVVNLAPTFEPFHTFGFGPRSLKAILKKNGFQMRRQRVYPGVDCLPTPQSPLGRLEKRAAWLVTRASALGSMGTYIECWAQKDGGGR